MPGPVLPGARLGAAAGPAPGAGGAGSTSVGIRGAREPAQASQAAAELGALVVLGWQRPEGDSLGNASVLSAPCREQPGHATCLGMEDGGD